MSLTLNVGCSLIVTTRYDGSDGWGVACLGWCAVSIFDLNLDWFWGTDKVLVRLEGDGPSLRIDGVGPDGLAVFDSW